MPTGIAENSIVDYHAHWYPPGYMESVLDRTDFPHAERRQDGGFYYNFDSGLRFDFPQEFFSLEEHIADMDAHGVDVAVLSPTVPGDVTRMELSQARETLDYLNAENARAQREHPDRIRGLAMLPLQDTTAALETLDKAIGELGLAGVCIDTNIAGHSLGTAELLPVYKRIEQLNVPIFLHPSDRSLFQKTVEDARTGRVGDIGLAWVFETSLAALSLILSGTLDETPDLKILHPHTGGVIPFVIERINITTKIWGNNTPRPIAEYLKNNFYVDPAAGANPHMVALAASTYGIDHIVFGSDYPFVSRTAINNLLTDLNPTDANQIRSNRLPGLKTTHGDTKHTDPAAALADGR
jgi:aminocarboxymuconate-semialdehyde decarboxylase